MRVFALLTFLLATISLPAQRTNYNVTNNKVLFIIGQDQGATGGFVFPNNNGYIDNFEKAPAGFTTYTNINALNGLKAKTNYGSGDVCAQCYLDNSHYDQSFVVVGLYMVNQLKNIVNGTLDDKIEELGEWIHDSQRPVFLRIGYEFNASWAGYIPSDYIKAFQYLVDYWESMGIENFNTVWQSDGYGSTAQLLQWYPGDDYVDWMAYSHFEGKGESILSLAREYNKPVMIAEATPRKDLKSLTANQAWSQWFKPFFNHIDKNLDVIKAFSYISTDWDSQDMWKGQGWGDSRLHVNPELAELWKEEISTEKYIHGYSSLFNDLAEGYVSASVSNKGNLKLKKSGNQYVIYGERSKEWIHYQVYNLQGKCLISSRCISGQAFSIPTHNKPVIIKLTSNSESQTVKMLTN